MDKNKKEKMCSFYVSKNHLATILITYLKENLKDNEKLNVFVEDDFNNEIKNIIDKVNIKESRKRKILNETWKNKDISKIKRIKGLVIVEGDLEYIERVNTILKDNIKIKLINCFNLNDFKNNSRKILEEHKFIINTLGKRKIPDIFDKNVALERILTK